MSRREKLRENMLAEIKAAARQQMAESGTASISLSAIARALEVSQPALYRYYASRDELITALILDAFHAQADALEASAAQIPDDQSARQLLTVMSTYREWALAHPVDFQLIYGNPIPGYQAPAAATDSAAWRTFTVFLTILNRAYQSGRMVPSAAQEQAARALDIGFPGLKDSPGSHLPQVVLYLGMVGMYRIHGMIMLEMFHHIDAVIPDGAAFYQHEIEDLLRTAGMQIETSR